MATVNRQSLREEFERLKAEFGHLSAAGGMPAETHALFNALLMLFEVLMAIFMEKTTGKGRRGRIAKSDAHNLWERLKKHERAVLLFAKESTVPFTNNRAERDLRMSKVKQKVSGCFRTERYAQAYCRISSYLQTMQNRGYNPLVAIQIALSGEIYEQGGE